MKKLIGLIIAAVLLSSISYACGKKKNPAVKTQTDKQIEVLAAMDNESSAPNRIWVGTFQIVWNEVIDNITKKPIEFVGGTTQTAKYLNERKFNKTDISEDSYYTKFGTVSPQLKKEIEKGIKEKFNETSDILGAFDFKYDPMKMFFYAMLKKDFQFLKPFDRLDKGAFGQNPNEVKYFGIKKESSHDLYPNVSVLFYNSDNDMAVKLHTKNNDEVILYRTDEDKKFSEYLADLDKKTENFKGQKYFGSNDRLKVPDIKLYQMTNFPELENKSIAGTDFYISQTLETVDFRMDNEGVKLKSEAAIMMKATAMPGRPPQIRYFYFDDNFVLFLKEKDKNVPYYAMRVHDVEILNKTGKKD